MIWLTWRQFRGSAAMMAAVLIVLAVALAATGPGLVSAYSAGIADCTKDNTCDHFYNVFFNEYNLPFMALTLAVLILPAVVGIFWGAPLITRELEAGTYLLVWNQSITRGRWLTVKLGLTGLVAMAVAGLCGLMVTWWSDPLDESATESMALMAPLVFSARGIAPMGYAAFAFVLGVTVGMVVRRTLPAMALTLAAFAAIQLALPATARPHLMAPVTATFQLGRANIDSLNIDREGGGAPRLFLREAVPGHPGSWVLTNELLDPSGRVISGGSSGTGALINNVSSTSGPCKPSSAAGGEDGCLGEINRLGYRQQVTYQPLERFWLFQWIETGIYALLTVGMTWLSFWWIRRRLS
ncbi:ABC transporter permease [Nonomuraea sp. NEAU-A123]|uniref:ABC transporter permease n=1 Tax=Nonomuraea sp. NEAU-A123 TaxID=2839649 RepID=UPI001BE4DA9D|nr:ABC transporter permease [Nonomuraea sp. NEAU-A123]MBT2233556.1 ABC transporter permease [Nonomuraea sp. NEAU-A123]